MKHKWLTATALAGMLALSPALAQQSQQQQPEQGQVPEQQQPEEQQAPPEQQPEEQAPPEQQPEEQQAPPEQQPEEQQVPPGQQPEEQMPPEQEQQPQEEEKLQQEGQMPETIPAMSREQLVGKDLYGSGDKRIGEIRDVVQSPQGEIEAVLVDVGGFLGIGAKQVAVPAHGLEARGDRIVAADLTEEEIKNLPEFEKAEQERQ